MEEVTRCGNRRVELLTPTEWSPVIMSCSRAAACREEAVLWVMWTCDFPSSKLWILIRFQGVGGFTGAKSRVLDKSPALTDGRGCHMRCSNQQPSKTSPPALVGRAAAIMCFLIFGWSPRLVNTALMYVCMYICILSKSLQAVRLIDLSLSFTNNLDTGFGLILSAPLICMICIFLFSWSTALGR